MHEDRKGLGVHFDLSQQENTTRLYSSNDSSVPLLPVRVTVNLHAQL